MEKKRCAKPTTIKSQLYDGKVDSQCPTSGGNTNVWYAHVMPVPILPRSGMVATLWGRGALPTFKAGPQCGCHVFDVCMTCELSFLHKG